MLRGKTWFRCPNCGHIFEAPDIEENATIRSVPMPCPKCGTKSNTLGRIGLLDILFRRIK